MQEQARTDWDENGGLEVVTFDLGEERFAIEAFMVHEIVDMLPETTVPGASPLTGTVVNYRGKIIPVVDLRLAFLMDPAAATLDSRIIVIEAEFGEETVQFGLRTDKVHEVATLQRDASEPVPAVGMRWRRDHVRGLVRAQDAVVVLPDLAAIFKTATTEGGASTAAPLTQ